jgi:AraC-like DNA-binding protein
MAEKIRVKDILVAFRISEKQFYAIMAAENQTLPAVINTIRIDKSKELLSGNNEMNIEEISLAVGYKASNNFATIFKKFEGLSPKEYRAKTKGLIDKQPEI